MFHLWLPHRLSLRKPEQEPRLLHRDPGSWFLSHSILDTQEEGTLGPFPQMGDSVCCNTAQHTPCTFCQDSALGQSGEVGTLRIAHKKDRSELTTLTS